MTPEDMRNIWETTIRSGRNPINRETIDLSRKTSLDRLRKNYRVFSCISFSMVAVSGMFLRNDFFPAYLRIPAVCALTSFFLTSGCMDYWLYRKVSTMDVYRMSVRETAYTAIRCRKWHHVFMAVLIPFAIFILSLFAVGFMDNKSALGGAVVGGIIGGFIGLKKYKEIMRDYKVLSETEWEDEH